MTRVFNPLIPSNLDDVGDDGTAALASHVAASNPHPVYLTAAEGDAAYSPLAHAGSTVNPHAVTLAQVDPSSTAFLKDGSRPATSHFDLAGFMLKNSSIHNGATLPATPSAWQSFIHTPTGRMVLMTYDGTNWVPIYQFGAATYYVDFTNGTDSADKGYGTTTNAFKTVSYAASQIAGNYSGHIYAYLSADTYREMVTVRGKAPTGAFNIYFIGTLTTTLADTTATSGAARTSATASGSITKTSAGWTVNAYQHKLLYIVSGTGAGQYRPVLSNTADTIYVEAWETTPNNTSHIIIYDRATRITGADSGADTTPVRANAFIVAPGQNNVYVWNIKFDYTTSHTVDFKAGTAGCEVRNCWILNNNTAHKIHAEKAELKVYSTLVDGSNAGGWGFSNDASKIEAYDTWIKGNQYGTHHRYGDLFYLVRCRIDSNTTYGVYAERCCATSLASTTALKNSIIDHSGAGDSGTYSEHYGIVFSATAQYFNGNTTDYAAGTNGSYT